MDRLRVASREINGFYISSILDVGCRSGSLRGLLRSEMEYFGCDLVPGDHVQYAGDIQQITFDRRFDCVVALDILEHVDQLHSVFDRLADLATKVLVVSLPNCYDLKGRLQFGIRGRLGGKYEFGTVNSVDRHRWLMGYSEIRRFYKSKAMEHGFQWRSVNCLYGDLDKLTPAGVLGVGLRALGPSLTAETVVGVFHRS